MKFSIFPLRWVRCALLVGAAHTAALQAAIDFRLPFPPVVDGVGVAQKYDMGVSYSLPLLDDIQDQNPLLLPVATYGNYDDLINGSGSGNLDIVIYTGAGGKNNLNVNGDPSLDFAKPLDAPGGAATSFSGTWKGAGSATDPHNTVGKILDYLHQFDPNNHTPVFLFDNNQTGVNASQQVSADVRVLDSTGTNVLAHWSFDALNTGFANPGNNVYDPTNYVSVTPTINATGISGSNYSVNHNLGSGKTEFAAFFPGMDLSQFASNARFEVEVRLNDLNDGFEELYLTGRVGLVPPPPPPPPGSAVPEPSTLAMFSLAIGGLVLIRRRSQRRTTQG